MLENWADIDWACFMDKAITLINQDSEVAK